MSHRLPTVAAISAGAALLAMFVSPAAAQDEPLSLRLPKEEKVVYRGVVSFDAAGTGAGNIMYPAPNAAGLLVAIITHGVIMESAREMQKNRMQSDADRVLSPYEAVLKDYSYNDLAQRALKRMTARGTKRLLQVSESPDAERMIEGTPVFFMTQDQSALVLDSTVTIHAPGAATPAYQNTVRVVSKAREEENIVDFWNADQGEALKEQSAILLAEAMDIAVRALLAGASSDGNPSRTIRYMEGKTEKMERGQLMSEHCGRVVIKNLRGWLMSVPVRPAATPASACNEKQPEEK